MRKNKGTISFYSFLNYDVVIDMFEKLKQIHAM